MKLTEALGVIRNLPNSKIHSHKTINLLSDQQLTQFKLVLRAKNILNGVEVEFIDEAYGRLIGKCYASEKSDVNIIVVDSYSLGLSLLVRGGWKLKNDKKIEQEMATYLTAIKSFCGVQKTPTIIVPIFIRADVLNILERSQFTSNQIRWLNFLMELSTIKEFEYTYVLNGSEVSVDEMRFLETGEFLTGESLSLIVEKISPNLDWIFLHRFPNECGKEIKLLITDLDNTFWSGIIGDDGKENLFFQETHKGKRHWVFQKFLNYLHHNGIVIAACSKNDPGVIEDAFNSLSFVFPSNHFSLVKANWLPKSINVSDICKDLNILHDNVLFIDDNELELAEVKLKLESIQTLKFPDKKENFDDFLQKLSSWFTRIKPMISVQERMDSYQAMQDFTREKNASQNNDEKFMAYLDSLQMEIDVAKVSVNTKERCFELINKTNQFNLNGKRYTEQDLEELKVYMYSVSLKDRVTDHGIIAVVVIQNGICEQFVLSCRVFSRFIEHAIVGLFQDEIKKIRLIKTEKNTYALDFITKCCSVEPNSEIEIYPVSIKPNPCFPGKIKLS